MSAMSRKSFYLLRHWRGQLGLGVSFWINFLLLFVIAIFSMTLLGAMLGIETEPGAARLAIIAAFLAVAALFIWQAVGVWRSGSRRIREGGSRWPTYLARGVLACAALVLALKWSATLPHLDRLAELEAGIDNELIENEGDPLTVTVDAQTAHVSGHIIWGADRQLAALLDSHPEVEVVELSSKGGRIGPSLRLGRLIAARGMSTYVSELCGSACILAFVAGNERLLRRGANLGFHAPASYLDPNKTTTATDDTRLQQQIAIMNKYYRDAGVSQSFLDQVMKTPLADAWYPSERELIDAGVVTRVVE